MTGHKTKLGPIHHKVFDGFHPKEEDELKGVYDDFDKKLDHIVKHATQPDDKKKTQVKRNK